MDQLEMFKRPPRTDVVAVTGIRDLDPTSIPDVELALADAMATAKEVRFGGALGVDTVALRAAARLRGARRRVPRLVVYVPFRASDQPAAARGVIALADEVVELRLPRSKWAYLRRNDKMLDGATRALAFTDGKRSGGTHYTAKKATDLGIPVTRVLVQSTTKENPVPVDLEFSRPVFGMLPYVSATEGDDPTSNVIRKIKAAVAEQDDVERLAEQIAEYIDSVPELAVADAIVPMPRRRPGVESDIWFLTLRVARATGKTFLSEWLERAKAPEGGTLKYRRMRFTPEQHAETMTAGAANAGWKGTRDPRRVIVLDNVITSGGTMQGAFSAIERDTTSDAVGLGVLYAPKVSRWVEDPSMRKAM